MGDGISPRTMVPMLGPAQSLEFGMGIGVEEALRVRVHGPFVDVVGRSNLDNLPQIHHANSVQPGYRTTDRSCDMTS